MSCPCTPRAEPSYGNRQATPLPRPTACPCGWPLPAQWSMELDGEDDDVLDEERSGAVVVVCPVCGERIEAGVQVTIGPTEH